MISRPDPCSFLQRRPMANPLSWYQEKYPDKKQAMAEAYRSGAYTMKEISEYFGVHCSTVSRAVTACEEGA